MRFTELGSGEFMLRLEKREAILLSLKRFAKSKNLEAAVFEGIGSLNEVKLGHYDFTRKSYRYEVFREELEILTLSGNISILDKLPLPHAHVTLGRRDFSVIGGHLDEGSSANMVEIVLRAM